MSVMIVVYTREQEVLLLQRQQPFVFWQSVTGSLEPGETPADAARREFREETGLVENHALADTGISRTFTIDPRWRDRYAPGVTENTEHEWHCCLQEKAPVKLCAREHAEYGWFGIDDAIDRVWSWTNREALENLRAGWK